MGLQRFIKAKIEEWHLWEDEYAVKAMSETFRGFHRVGLLVLDLSKKKALLSITMWCGVFLVLLSISSLLIFSCYKMSDDFEDSSGECNLGFLALLSMLFLLNHNYYRKLILILYRMLGKGFHVYNEPQFNPETVEEYKRYLRRLNLSLIVLACYIVFIAILVVFIGPYVDELLGFGWKEPYDVFGVNRQLPVPLWVPFPSHEGLGYWVSLVIFECFGGFMFTLSIGGTALLFTGLCGGLLMEQKLLFLSIKNIDKRAKRLYKLKKPFKADDGTKTTLYDDPLFQECIGLCLQQNVQHHHSILYYHENFGLVARLPLLASFLIETMAIAMSMMKLNEGSAKWGANISFGCITIAELAAMVMLCVLGENITTASEDINREIYFTKWYKFNKKNRLFLLQFLIQTRTPMTMSALGLVVCNMDQFSSVMNSAYSFFNLLKVSKAREAGT